MQDSSLPMMFYELSDSRSQFCSNYDDGMADSIFSLPLMDTSPLSDLSYDLGSSPNSDDFNDGDYFDGMIDELLSPHYLKYDIDKQPQLLNLVSPNDVLPVDVPVSIGGPFLNYEYGNKMLLDDPMDIVESDSSSVLTESLEQLCDASDQFLSDKVLNEIIRGGPDICLLDDDLLASITDSEDSSILEEDSSVLEEEKSESSENVDSCSRSESKPYTIDSDHCYYTKLSEEKPKDEKEMKMRFLNVGGNGWKSMGSPDTSGSSSEEVDVVTVTEELQAPFVPKVQASHKNKRRKRGAKSQKSKKYRSTSLSSRVFNDAMRKNMKRIEERMKPRTSYIRRKINNSVETTPSNSLPSSAPSSRCSSDGEEAGKRANHNSSERKRREVLRANLQTLRLNVPCVKDNAKAPKVVILTSATLCVRDLEQEELKLCAYKKNLKNRTNLLRTKLRNLKSEITESNRQFWQEMWLPNNKH